LTFKSLLFLAHLQAFIIPIILSIKSIRKFQQISFPFLIPYAFISLGLASMFEMFDHTTTDWIYIDHSSIFNWLFYSFLSIGLSFFTISVTKNKLILATNIVLIITAISSYWLLGKSSTLIFQVFISILLISEWWVRFKDWVFLIYPITGVIFTTCFGIILSSSGEQIWHVFIGPSGTISVLAFYSVLIRSRKKETLFT
tara:strand:- start:7051 stop:7647 length:597 start_codon:yes stop_codon:yes gene_type:complete